jgi:hypothetical protein
MYIAFKSLSGDATATYFGYYGIMKKLHIYAFCIFTAAIAVAFSHTAFAEPWLQIIKSKNGFLYKGTEFSFDIPGETIQIGDDQVRAIARIDDFLVQTFKTKAKKSKPQDALETYKKSEMAYLNSNGLITKESNYCNSAKLPHAEWASTRDTTSKTTYVVFKLKRELLIVAFSAESHVPDSLMEEKVLALCNSFKG